MNMDLLCALMVLFTNIILCGVIVYTGYQLHEDLEKKRKLQEIKLNLSFKSEKEDMLVLDSIINDLISEYKILHFEYETDLYINEKMMNDMIITILKQTLQHVSPVLYTKLKYVYNENILEDIILKKIKMAVLDYTVEINGSYKD